MRRKQNCSFSYRFANVPENDEIFCNCTMMIININKTQNISTSETTSIKNTVNKNEDIKIIVINEIY